MSDRVLVMREGRITGRFERGEATQEKIMAAATGVNGDGADRGLAKAQVIPPRRFASSLLRVRELGVAAFVILVFIVCAAIQPRFLSAENLRSILLYIPLIVVVSMGQMMLIVSRNIDLSVGSILGFAAIIVGNVFIRHPGCPLIIAALIATGIGGALGAFNGVLVALLRVP